MEILNEVEEKIVKWDVDFEPTEKQFLMNYSLENMPREVMHNFLIEWALVSILKKSVDKLETELKVKKTKAKIKK